MFDNMFDNSSSKVCRLLMCTTTFLFLLMEINVDCGEEISAFAVPCCHLLTDFLVSTETYVCT